MAAELAPWLVESHPCDVCGATVHPRPAGPSVDGEVEASRVALVAAERFVEACIGLLARPETHRIASVDVPRTVH
jgi:hypothetical protein